MDRTRKMNSWESYAFNGCLFAFLKQETISRIQITISAKKLTRNKFMYLFFPGWTQVCISRDGNQCTLLSQLYLVLFYTNIVPSYGQWHGGSGTVVSCSVSFRPGARLATAVTLPSQSRISFQLQYHSFAKVENFTLLFYKYLVVNNQLKSGIFIAIRFFKSILSFIY